MRKPLGDHITGLQLRLQTLRDELTRPGLTPEARERVLARIRVAEEALRLYVEAFELEQKSA